MAIRQRPIFISISAFFWAALGVFLSAQAQDSVQLFVSVSGNDSHSGSLEQPFATVARARDAVRVLRQSRPESPCVVQIGAGFHELTEPLVFGPEDSGSAQAPVVYRAAPGTKVVLSGGRRLTGWIVDARGYWNLELPSVRAGKWSFSQLFVNGQRRLRPRLPEQGSYFIARDASPRPGEQQPSHDRLHFYGQDLRADWKNPGDIEAVIFHIWSVSRHRFAQILPDENLAILTGPPPSADQSWSGLKKDHRYFLENVAEALNEPGEWYLDRPSGRLTYIPLPGEDPASAVAVAPVLDHLVRFEGDAAQRRWVEHIRLEGLSLAHADYQLPPEGYGCPQAESHLAGAVRINGGRDCALLDCGIMQVATYGLEIDGGSKRVAVTGCDLADLGAGGIKIGSMNQYDDQERVTSHITIENSTIAQGGRLYPAGIGVWIGNAHHCRIAHNDIFDFFYSGMSIGWTWGYGPSQAHHNLVEANHIHTLGQWVLSDMGAIYTLGISPGTLLRGNHMHEVYSYAYGGWGIYYDEGSTGVVAENNLVYRVKDGCFHQHYGKENIVRDNILAWSTEAQVKRTRVEGHISFHFTGNIVYWKDAPLLGSNFDGNNYRFDNNIYWRTDGEPVTFMGRTLEQWRQQGQDLHSVIVDPGFVDAENHDYRFQPDSPALTRGFKSFDVKSAGRRTPSRRVAVGQSPASPFQKMLFEQTPPVLPIRDGFELGQPGWQADNCATWGEGGGASIRIAEGTAAGGNRALKFTDAAGLAVSWAPHIYYDPRMESGIATGRFSIRMEPGAVLYHEWRTEGHPYHTGPQLRIEADGALTSRGHKLMDIPGGQWIGIQIECPLGAAANGRWRLTVTLPGGQPQRFDNLECDGPFNRFRWMGFVADANGPGVFYLDNLAVTNSN